MNTELVDAISPKARKTFYLIFAALTIAVGAFQVGFSSAELAQPVWLDVATAVIAFLGGAFGVTAYTNTNKGGAAVVGKASEAPSAGEPTGSAEAVGPTEGATATEVHPIEANETQPVQGFTASDGPVDYTDPASYVGQEAPVQPVTSAEVETPATPQVVDTTNASPYVGTHAARTASTPV